ncbi:UDP-N-acetylglucosamine/UDP-N-acetylgalactosaminediphosphorylase [Paenibacillus sp. 1_12]|uniref:UTP--glucose-1-phosphate uridylyltransferase n=1 Tax=Paenibacillus sp. 1_12 TaxID=1566278 RepID=UPI0008E708E7|nr:UDPGP type 1 family protein [Paenibacillus sp. 1_12]SFL36548.1 UDP-N-acetylglucosamine/UDP-N-acetylgalactosaminediphosphorylase [Paenibacillus sp. 1_12]
MEELYNRVLEQLSRHNQTHLLQFYDQLSVDSQEKLLNQIQSIDWKQWDTLSELCTAKTLQTYQDLTPIGAFDWELLREDEQLYFTNKGWDLLRQGKVGAIVVAGGQGSRLGHEGPKGTYDIGLPSHKSLFQLQAERLLNLSRRAGRRIPWYIMTSPDNHQQTVDYMAEADYFGYGSEDCKFFEQGVMPAVDENGRIFLSEMDEISLAPSGNGECFSALNRSGMLTDMKHRGVDWLFYYNVDNALIKVADPAFLGVAAHYNHPVATKVIDKAYPEEKVGIIGMKGNRPMVVEYSDLPKQLMFEYNSDGKLTYGLGNISIHLFRRDWIEQLVSCSIPYHIAHKKIRHLDSNGQIIEAAQPNGYKFERFIFDFFPLAEAITVLKGKREMDFAPVKNKDGEDSPQTARELIYELHRSWLVKAGVVLDEVQGPVEISPLVSYEGEGVTAEAILASMLVSDGQGS